LKPPRSQQYNNNIAEEIYMSLTNDDVRIILGMSARGDNKHDIAAWFGVNQARIAEAEAGSHGSLEMAPAERLFPKGAPGPKGRKLRAFAERALRALEEGNASLAKEELEKGIAVFNKHST
jgi:hypothetical protein